MNVLFITSFIPEKNASQAGVNVSYNMLKILRDELKCNLDVICTHNIASSKNVDDINEISEEQFIIPLTKIKKVLNIIANINKPLIMAVRYDKRVRRKLKEISLRKQYDLIFIDYTQNISYINDVKRYFNNAKTAIIEHDVSFLGFERKYLSCDNKFKKFIYYLEYKRLLHKEKKLLALFNKIYTLNDKDASLIKEIKNVEVLCPFIKDWNVVKNPHKEFNIMYWGAMNRKENEDAVLYFIKNIWDRVKDENTYFYIIGANPGNKIKQIDDKHIILTGFVENPAEYFSIIDLSVVPLRLGAGIKIKVLESMANNIPIITTSVGSEGINIIDDNTFIVEDNHEEFINKINKLKNDEQLRNTMQINGRKCIDKNYGFFGNKNILENFINESR